MSSGFSAQTDGADGAGAAGGDPGAANQVGQVGQVGIAMEPSLRGLFLRAGDPLPPGLSATRESERREGQRELRQLLFEAWGDQSAFRAAEVLAEQLHSAKAAVDPRLWVACATLAGELDWENAQNPAINQLVERLAAGLGDDCAAEVRSAAQSALHRLIGRWFADSADCLAFWEQAREQQRGELFHGAWQSVEADNLELLRDLLELQPERALESLTSNDPRVRSLAVRAVGKAIGDGGLEPRVGMQALFEVLDEEANERVFALLLETLTAPLAGESPQSPSVRRLRKHLASCVAKRRPYVQIAVARGLAGLPWELGATDPSLESDTAEDGETDPEDHISFGLSLLAEQLESQSVKGALTPERSDFDADVLSAGFQTVQGLARQVDHALLNGGAERAARVAGFWLGDESLAAAPSLEDSDDSGFAEFSQFTPFDRAAWLGVRISAAGALTALAGPDDLEPLLLALHADNKQEQPSDALRFALLGSLETLAKRFEVEYEDWPDPRTAEPLLRGLSQALGDQNPDLRRQALSVLSRPRLASMAGAQLMDTWIELLNLETKQDLVVGMCRLIRAQGHASEVRPLLQMENFNRLAALGAPQEGATPSSSGNASESALTASLLKLSSGSLRLSVDSAHALMAAVAPLSAAHEEQGRLARQRSLEFFARISRENAALLTADEHADCVRWSLELLRAEAALPDPDRRVAPKIRALVDQDSVSDIETGAAKNAANGDTLLARLVELHLPALDGVEQYRGLFYAARGYCDGLLALQRGRLDPERVRSQFEAAFELAEREPKQLSKSNLHLDRARLFYSVAQNADSWADYELLLSESAAAPEASSQTKLPLADLRRAAEVCGSLPALTSKAEEQPLASAGPDVAFGIDLLLLRHSDWRSATSEQRTLDLQRWVGHALVAEDSSLATQCLEALQSIAPEAAAMDAPAGQWPANWSEGLDRASLWDQLSQQRSALEQRLAEPPPESPGPKQGMAPAAKRTESRSRAKPQIKTRLWALPNLSQQKTQLFGSEG